MYNSVTENIKNRRSIRKYKSGRIPDELIGSIIDAARWAPSGLNNQPWRFAIINDHEIKDKLSSLTKYKHIVQDADTLIVVFYNLDSGYNRDKDIMSIGACIQNMLLAAESFKIGSVWLGEILNRKSEFNQVIQIDSSNELMAVIALGFPDETPVHDRLPAEQLILKRI